MPVGTVVTIVKPVDLSTSVINIIFGKQVVSIELGNGKSVSNLQTPLRIKQLSKPKSTLWSTKEVHEKVSFVV